MIWNKMKKHLEREEGQSMVEFALILPIILLLLLVPVDVYRYANTQMLLNSANSDIVSQVVYVDPMTDAAVKSQLTTQLQRGYSGMIDVNSVVFDAVVLGSERKVEYNYYVYSSDLENNSAFQDKFQERLTNTNKPAEYKVRDITVQISYKIKPSTFWGTLFFGNEINIQSSPYKRAVYCGGL